MEYLPLCHGCPALSPPTHGYVSITPFQQSSSRSNGTYYSKFIMGIESYVLAFSCHVQLYFSNSGHQTNPDNASNRNSTSNYKATYSCQEGYLLTLGDRVRTCGVLGDWRGRQPLCRCINF